MRIEKIGNATLILGDCVDVLKTLDNNSIDLVLVDSPYGNNYCSRMRKDKDHDFCKPIINDNDFNFLSAFDIVKDKMKNNTSFFNFCSINSLPTVRNYLDNILKYKNTIIWDKMRGGMADIQTCYAPQYECILYYTKGRVELKGKRYSDLWQCKRILGLEQEHQNQKPIELLKRCIESSSNENDVVLDPFMGSGSTGVACVNTNRHFIGIEINEKYFDIACKRIREAVNNKQHELF